MGPAKISRRASSVHRGLPAKKRHEVLAPAGTGDRTNGAPVTRDPARDAKLRLDFVDCGTIAAWPYE